MCGGGGAVALLAHAALTTWTSVRIVSLSLSLALSLSLSLLCVCVSVLKFVLQQTHLGNENQPKVAVDTLGENFSQGHRNLGKISRAKARTSTTPGRFKKLGISEALGKTRRLVTGPLVPS